MRAAAVALLCALAPACKATPDEPAPAVCPPLGTRRVVTADWLNRSLTLLDYGRVVSPACTVGQAITGKVDLAAYAPGPIELALTIDGKRALVAVGPGSVSMFLSDDPVPAGGALLVVDLDARKVTAEVQTSAIAEGVAVSPDGKTGWAALFGAAGAPGNSIAKIDLDSGQAVETKVFGRPKQIAISVGGARGIVSLADNGTVRIFDTSDVPGTIGAPIMTGADPSGVAFVGATGASAVVANALSFDYAVLDIEGTSAKLRGKGMLGGSAYGVTAIPGKIPGKHLVALTSFVPIAKLWIVDTVAAPTMPELPIELEGGAYPLTVAVDDEGAYAFVAHGRDHALSVIDLQARSVRTLRWLEAAGPTYVAVGP
jgi:DNA-binding beta-propeller fold protein YncE